MIYVTQKTYNSGYGGVVRNNSDTSLSPGYTEEETNMGSKLFDIK